ncbi:hypothetical protein [Hymenobacter rigui]|uniref:Lipocalin-like domain-containing protein n=1 Tax=Hymenobacter rigui TaxID=334424 RepID=A0A3R9MNU0_9BACT|nr:hypothetical protein [Hymenobacter rigui]RSK50140.1 hypothetical protein EI291_05665 [Hymenobacter rigui]
MKAFFTLAAGTLLLLASCGKDAASPKSEPKPRLDGQLVGTWKMVQVSQRTFTRADELVSEWKNDVADKDTRYLTFSANPDVMHWLEVYPDSAVTGPYTYRHTPNQLSIDSVHMTMPLQNWVENYRILELSDERMILEMRQERGIPYYHLFAMYFKRQP